MSTPLADSDPSPIDAVDRRDDYLGVTIEYEYNGAPVTLIINRAAGILFIQSPVLNQGLVHRYRMAPDDWTPLVELVRQELGVVFTARSFLGYKSHPEAALEFEIDLSEETYLENRFEETVVEILRAPICGYGAS